MSSLVIAFFVSPFVVHRLGSEEYGLWVLTVSIGGFLGLVDFGVRGTVTYYIARLHTLGKHDDASRLISSALVLFTLFGLVVILAASILGRYAPTLFRIPPGFNVQFRVIIALAGVNIAVNLIGGVFGAALTALQRFDVINLIDAGASACKALAVLLVLARGGGLVSLALIQLFFSILAGLISARAISMLYPQLRVGYTLSNWQNIALVASFGSFLFVLNVSTQIIFFTDSAVIGKFLPLSEITVFSIAGTLVIYSRSLIVNGISYTISPLASSLEAQGRARGIATMISYGPRFATIFLLPVVVTFAIRGKVFIGLWMGPMFANESGRVLQLLSIALFFSAANQIATSAMIGINRHRPVVFWSLIEALANLSLSIIFVRKLGVIGAALGTVIPSVISSLVFWPSYIRRIAGISQVQYVLDTWGRPAVAAIPFAVASMYVNRFWYATTIPFYFVQVTILLPVIALSVWLGCLSPDERLLLSSRFTSRTVRMEEGV